MQVVIDYLAIVLQVHLNLLVARRDTDLLRLSLLDVLLVRVLWGWRHDTKLELVGRLHDV